MRSSESPALRAVLRVLLVEDSEDDALLIQHELERAGYQVTGRRVDTVAGLREALAEPWDVVTCDWKMPGFGGAEALAILTGACADAPIILVSGEIGEEFAVTAMRAGAHDFVSKHHLDRLPGAVERGLREAEERRARRRAERALRATEARFRAMMESTLDQVAVLDAEGTFLYANPSYETLCGYPPTELVGTSAFDLVVPEDRARLHEDLAAGVRARRRFETVEFRVRHRDGSTRLVEAVAHNRLDDAAIGGIVLNGRDITARRRIEETVRLQSAIMGNLPEGVSLTRVPDAVILHANQKFEQMFGYGPGELVGQHVSVLNAPEAQSAGRVLEEIMGRLRATGEWEGEVHSRRKDGSTFWTHARIARFQHPDHGEVWVTTQADVTERKATESALARERTLLKTLIDSMPDVVFFKDPRGVYVACNAAAERPVGSSRDSILGHTDEEIFPPEVAALHRRGDQDAIAAGGPTSVRGWLTVGESRRAFETVKTPMRDANGEFLGVLGVARDVTDQYEREEVLRQRLAVQAQLEQTAAIAPGVIASVHRRADGTTCVPYASAGIRELFGLDPGDVREDAAPVWARVHRHDVGEVRASALESMRTMAPWSVDFRVVHPTRGTIWVAGRAIPQADGAGGILWHGFFSDVTDRRRSEEQARRWLELFQAANFGLTYSNALTGTLIEVNRAFANQRGYEPEELAGRPILDLFPPEEQERWRQVMQEIDATGHMAVESVHQRKDGTCFPVLLEVTAIRDASGRVVSRLACAFDLSEQRRREEEERRHAEHYRAITRTSFDGFWRVDWRGRLLDVNDAYCRLSGYTRDELLGMTVADVEAIETPEAVERHIAAIQAGGEARFETRHRRRDGTAFDVEISVLVLGEGTQALGFLRDITERKEAERRLRESSARLRSTMDSLLEGLRIIDVGWRHVYVNAAAAVQMRRPAAELVGQTLMEVLPGVEATDLFAAMQRCMDLRLPQTLETEMEFPDGRRSWFDVSVEPVPEGIALLSVETTQRKRAEHELRELNAELEQRVEQRTAQLAAANQELEAFSYSVSHDLRAPLRAVDGFSRAVLEDYGPALPAEGRRYLEHVRAGARRMAELIEHLLRLSRLARQPLDRRMVDCQAMVGAVVAELRAQRAGPAPEVRLGDLPPCAADPTLLRQVWVNLIDNAFKYSAAQAAPAIEVGSERRDGAVVYFVRDNGAGFDMAQAQRLFGVFQRLHSAEEFEGTGVGLAIVQRIVHRHGGRVWATGAVGTGATFFFTLGNADAPSPPVG